ncbi:MAG: hypothetical protein JNM88_21480 [Chitinophagaceae bacterium]|nr:hypothetical protein [Chitinophagaceae bacterium]
MRLSVLLSAVVCLLVFSCTKKDEIKTTHLTNSRVAEIRLWLSEKASKIRTTEEKNRFADLNRHLQYEKLKTEELKNGEKMILVPVDTLYTSGLISQNNAALVLLLFETKSGAIKKGNLVHYQSPTVNHYSRIPVNSFQNLYRSLPMPDCSVKFYTLTERFLYDFTYQNGTLQQFDVLKSHKKAIPTEDGCIDWYLQTYENGILVSEVYVFSTCGSYVEDGSGGSQVYTGVGIQTITDQLTNPCLKSVLNQATASNMNNQVNVMLQTVFGSTEDANITIKEVTNLPADTDASHTASGTPGNTYFNSVINLNVNILPSTSQEYIAATIYHEIVHSYLTYNGTYGELTQHQAMAESYVDHMASSLMQLFPNMELYTATALAWQGLQGTTAWNNFAAAHPADAALYNSINTAHRAGSTGTDCN